MIYTGEFPSSIKGKIISLEGNWMELKIVMLTEINQAHKDMSHVFCHIWNIDLKPQGLERQKNCQRYGRVRNSDNRRG